MTPADLGLWALIASLPGGLPFTPPALQARLGVPLHERSSNEYFVFWEGAGVELTGGLMLEVIDLRIRRQQPHPGFLVLRLAGACVPKSEVFRRFPGMPMSEHPRGRSLDEEASYTHAAAWGSLSFGFAERRPDCLRTIVFDPHDDTENRDGAA